MLRGQTGPEDDFFRLRFEVFSLSHQPGESECRLRIVRRNHGTTTGAARQGRDQPHAQVCELLLPKPAPPPPKTASAMSSTTPTPGETEPEQRAICGREFYVSARQENLQQAVWEMQVWLSEKSYVDVVKQDHGAAPAPADEGDTDDPDPADPHFAMVLPFAACRDLFRAGAEPPFYWRGWLPMVDYERLRREDEYAAAAGGDAAVAGGGEGGGGALAAAASSAEVLFTRHVAAGRGAEPPEPEPSGEAVAPQTHQLDIGLTLLQHAESVPYLEDAPIPDPMPSESQIQHGKDLFQRLWTRVENQGF